MKRGTMSLNPEISQGSSIVFQTNDYYSERLTVLKSLVIDAATTPVLS